MSDDNKDHESHPNENLVVAEPDPDPADEAAGSRPERPQSRGVTRRGLLGLGTLGAGLLAYTSDYEDGGMTHSIARAATVPDEPLITVGPESDPVGYIFESSGDWVFKHEASGNEFFYNSAQDRWEAGTLAIDDLNINGEAIVEVEKTGDQSYSTAGGRAKVTWDNEVVDVTNSFDLANDRFTPPETGSYLIILSIDITTFADQDLFAAIFENMTDGTDVLRSDTKTSGTGREHVLAVGERTLNSNKTYAGYVNVGSDSTVEGDAEKTYMSISRSEEN